MTKAKDLGLLYKFNFPPYQVISYSTNSFIVCGGGGASKTGVPNRIELYELSEVGATDPLALPILKHKSSFDTGDKAIMSMRRHFNYLLTAEGRDVCEYILCEKAADGQPEEEQNGDEAVVKERRKSQCEPDVLAKPNEFQLKLHRRVEAFDENSQLEVNVVRYCGGASGGQLVAIGSTGGTVRIYQRYSETHPMDLVPANKQHLPPVAAVPNVAVIDIDVALDRDELVTVCANPDGRYARVWSLSRAVKITELALTSPPARSIRIEPGTNYRFRQCRYGMKYTARGGNTSFLLFCTHQPSVLNKRVSSYLSVWGSLEIGVGGADYSLIDVIALGNNGCGGPWSGKLVPTALCTSPCGSMAAIGSGEGQIDVYRLDEDNGPHRRLLQRIYTLPQAHSFFITDVTFLPSRRSLTSGHRFELLSIGVDNMLRYHRQAHRPSYLRFEGFYRLALLMVILWVFDRLCLLIMG